MAIAIIPSTPKIQFTYDDYLELRRCFLGWRFRSPIFDSNIKLKIVNCKFSTQLSVLAF
jgi:hypothetical protein